MSTVASASGSRIVVRRRRSGVRGALSRARAGIHAQPHVRFVYRVLVATIGVAVILLGLVLVPLPGPGWLVVFGGLAILGSEFVWAHRVASRLKRLISRVLASWGARRERRHPTPPRRVR